MPKLFRLLPLTVLVPLAFAALAASEVADPHVQRRMEAMKGARAALETLGDMAQSRTPFDPARGRTARKSLVKTTRAIPRLFRRARPDPLTRARPEIWSRWSDFKARADAAERAAKGIEIGNLNALRRTLPNLLAACLDCHKAYRAPR